MATASSQCTQDAKMIVSSEMRDPLSIIHSFLDPNDQHHMTHTCKMFALAYENALYLELTQGRIGLLLYGGFPLPSSSSSSCHRSADVSSDDDDDDEGEIEDKLDPATVLRLEAQQRRNQHLAQILNDHRHDEQQQQSTTYPPQEMYRYKIPIQTPTRGKRQQFFYRADSSEVAHLIPKMKLIVSRKQHDDDPHHQTSPLRKVPIIVPRLLNRMTLENVAGVTHMGERWFAEYPTLKHVIVQHWPDLEEIGSAFLSGCHVLGTVEIGGFPKLRRVRSSFLASNRILKRVFLYEFTRLEQIEPFLLAQCANLEEVHIAPDSFVSVSVWPDFANNSPKCTILDSRLPVASSATRIHDDNSSRAIIRGDLECCKYLDCCPTNAARLLSRASHDNENTDEEVVEVVEARGGLPPPVFALPYVPRLKKISDSWFRASQYKSLHFDGRGYLKREEAFSKKSTRKTRTETKNFSKDGGTSSYSEDDGDEDQGEEDGGVVLTHFEMVLPPSKPGTTIREIVVKNLPKLKALRFLDLHHQASFYSAPSLHTLRLGPGLPDVRTLSPSFLRKVNGLVEVYLSFSNLTEIGDGFCSLHSQLEVFSLHAPELTKIGSGFLSGVPTLKQLHFSSPFLKLKKIGADFLAQTGIESFSFTAWSSLQSIGRNCLAGCRNLKKVEIIDCHRLHEVEAGFLAHDDQMSSYRLRATMKPLPPDQLPEVITLRNLSELKSFEIGPAFVDHARVEEKFRSSESEDPSAAVTTGGDLVTPGVEKALGLKGNHSGNPQHLRKAKPAGKKKSGSDSKVRGGSSRLLQQFVPTAQKRSRLLRLLLRNLDFPSWKSSMFQVQPMTRRFSSDCVRS